MSERASTAINECPEHGDLCGGADCCCVDKHGTYTVLERLREASDGYLGCSWKPGCRCIYCAAADEIEALRDIVREVATIDKRSPWKRLQDASLRHPMVFAHALGSGSSSEGQQ